MRPSLWWLILDVQLPSNITSWGRYLSTYSHLLDVWSTGSVCLLYSLMLMRSIWCPSALGLRVVVSSACLCAACKVCQYPLCFMTVNASLLLGCKETLLRSQNLNVKWRSVRTKALLFWMFECIGWVLLVWIRQGLEQCCGSTHLCFLYTSSKREI